MPTEKYNSRSPRFVVATPVGGTEPNRRPTVVTNDETLLTQTSARLNGQVTDAGLPTYTTRGFYWKVGTGTPTDTDNDEPVSGTDTNSFSYDLSSLSAGTTYSFVAYATNTEGTETGDTVTFTTPVANSLATVTTDGESNVTQTSATLLGSITNVGVPSYTSRGFYWMQGTGTPDSGDNTLIVSGTGTGQFSDGLTGLTASTTYSFRAFAINTQGTAYGDVEEFTTLSSSTPPTTYAPSVTTNAATSPTQNSIVMNGNVTNVGNPNYTVKGFVYITGTGTPTTSNTITNETVVGTSAGTYNALVLGLTSGQLYTYRAFATNTVGTAYGANVQFTTSAAPVCDGGTLFFSGHQISGGNATLATGQISYGTGACSSTIPTVSLLLTNNVGEWTSVNQVTSIALYEGNTNVSSQYTLGKTLNGDVMNITFGGNFPDATNDGNHTYSFHLTVDTTENYATTISLPSATQTSSGDVSFVTSTVTPDTSSSYPASRDGSNTTSTLTPLGTSGENYKYTIVYTAISGYTFTGTGNITQPTVTSGVGVSVNVTGYTSSTLTVVVTGQIQSSDVSATVSYTGSPVISPATSATLEWKKSSQTQYTPYTSAIDVVESDVINLKVAANGSYYLASVLTSGQSLVSSISPIENNSGVTQVHDITINGSLQSGGDASATLGVIPRGSLPTISNAVATARLDFTD
jgi:hypothetical protein